MLNREEFMKQVKNELSFGNAYIVCYEDEVDSTYEEKFIYFESASYDENELNDFYSIYYEKF